jgi:hypothetical protein
MRMHPNLDTYVYTLTRPDFMTSGAHVSYEMNEIEINWIDLMKYLL